jgi:hypothetical protein
MLRVHALALAAMARGKGEPLAHQVVEALGPIAPRLLAAAIAAQGREPDCPWLTRSPLSLQAVADRRGDLVACADPPACRPAASIGDRIGALAVEATVGPTPQIHQNDRSVELRDGR